jgi:hypothetical protein
MAKHEKQTYPGKVSKEFPNGRDWHHVETAGLSTAGAVAVYVDPAGAVVLSWSRADVSVTAPDKDRGYNGPAALSVRLAPAEFQELVGRGMVAMASVEPATA